METSLERIENLRKNGKEINLNAANALFGDDFLNVRVTSHDYHEPGKPHSNLVIPQNGNKAYLVTYKGEDRFGAIAQVVELDKNEALDIYIQSLQEHDDRLRQRGAYQNKSEYERHQIFDREANTLIPQIGHTKEQPVSYKPSLKIKLGNNQDFIIPTSDELTRRTLQIDPDKTLLGVGDNKIELGELRQLLQKEKEKNSIAAKEAEMMDVLRDNPHINYRGGDDKNYIITENGKAYEVKYDEIEDISYGEHRHMVPGDIQEISPKEAIILALKNLQKEEREYRESHQYGANTLLNWNNFIGYSGHLIIPDPSRGHDYPNNKTAASSKIHLCGMDIPDASELPRSIILKQDYPEPLLMVNGKETPLSEVISKLEREVENDFENETTNQQTEDFEKPGVYKNFLKEVVEKNDGIIPPNIDATRETLGAFIGAKPGEEIPALNAAKEQILLNQNNKQNNKDESKLDDFDPFAAADEAFKQEPFIEEQTPIIESTQNTSIQTQSSEQEIQPKQKDSIEKLEDNKYTMVALCKSEKPDTFAYVVIDVEKAKAQIVVCNKSNLEEINRQPISASIALEKASHFYKDVEKEQESFEISYALGNVKSDHHLIPNYDLVHHSQSPASKLNNLLLTLTNRHSESNMTLSPSMRVKWGREIESHGIESEYHQSIHCDYSSLQGTESRRCNESSITIRMPLSGALHEMSRYMEQREKNIQYGIEEKPVTYKSSDEDRKRETQNRIHETQKLTILTPEQKKGMQHPSIIKYSNIIKTLDGQLKKTQDGKSYDQLSKAREAFQRRLDKAIDKTNEFKETFKVFEQAVKGFCSEVRAAFMPSKGSEGIVQGQGR